MGTTLNPLRLPLSGRQLIEASAGTGKTYTITSLVLRAVLGVGLAAPLGLGNVLIVTFTRAATEELRSRVRERLRAASLAFATGNPGEDAFIAELLELCDATEALRQLRIAELELDLAAIHTIHGFAQRTLAQYAFESGAAFDTRFDEQAFRLHQEVALDIWRERVYPLGAVATDAILQRFADAHAFVEALGVLAAHERPTFVDRPPADWPTLLCGVDEALQRLAGAWAKQAEQTRAFLAGYHFKKAGAEAIARALLSLDALVATAAAPELTALRVLQPDALNGALNRTRHKALVLEALPVQAELDTLLHFCDALPKRLLADADRQFRETLIDRKQQLNLMGYDDLLRLLDEGLQGQGSERLSQVLCDQFPLAMIDEFQDTDPLQWRVFSRVYRDRGCLLLIGDPKQAIYRFRGADIHAYIGARRATPQRHVLGTNFRSTAALVETLNALFDQRRDGDPFLAGADIPFVPVTPCAPERPVLCRQGRPVPSWQVLHLTGDKPFASGVARRQMARHCAHHLAALLDDGRAGRACVGEQPLRPGDVAILVRGRHEVAALKPALQAAGVDWVYQSRESVFSQPEAADIRVLLTAVINRGEERSLRTALACGLMSLDLARLEQLQHDESALFEHQMRFERLHQILQRDGVLAMLRQLLFDYEVIPRLLALADGERRLTDALHIAELLQLERETVEGDEALLARLVAHMASPDGDSEAQQLRLESDAGRVQIITMHSSKGLEYPVVYVPFPWAARVADAPQWTDADSLQRYWDLGNSDGALARADRERLAEDVRLLYVAFTRARQWLVTGFADVVPGRGPRIPNALDHLLDVEADDHASSHKRLASLPGVDLLDTRRVETHVLGGRITTDAPGSARVFSARIDDRWGISSYTSLTRSTSVQQEAFFRQPEIAAERLQPVTDGMTETLSLLDFPRGATHGSFLHTLLEHADFNAIGRGELPLDHVQQAAMVAGYEEKWVPVLGRMLEDVLGAVLDGDALRLADLPPAARRAEMAFDLGLGSADGSALDNLLRERGVLEPAAPLLSFSDVRGLLTGFIDLVFVHEGRYYVADYKSNYLGAQRSDYSPGAMRRSVCEHRYDLQYLIYSVALERHLRQRLGPAYRPELHFGGAYYLYLRGISATAGDGYGIWYARPDESLRAAVDAILGGGK